MEMATKAYFMIWVKEEFCRGGQIEGIVAELKAIPEVKCVEQIDGACDLLVEIEAPIRVIFVANKVRVKEWVKDFRMFKVEPLPAIRHRKLALRDILKAPGRLRKDLPGSTTGEQRPLLEEAEKIIANLLKADKK